MPGTIKDTANKGYLDLKLVPERHNTVKVLLFFDIGGSMDAHIKLCEELFSAAKTEFKHMDFFYFHNCLYEAVWKDNRRRHNEKLEPGTCCTNIPHDYKVIFVGDATMSPYEITYPGGTVEHWNEEAGRGLARPRDARCSSTRCGSIRSREKHWDYTPSIGLMQQLMNERMYPLTLGGLDQAMRELNR